MLADGINISNKIALNNYISDLYVVNMKAYKAPNTTRVNIQPYYHRIWNRTWKNGSLVDIAPHFDYDKYASLNKEGRYQYLLDLIHTAMLQLSAEYQWEVSVFQKAYENVMASRFAFTLDYPAKRSSDKRSAAHVRIEKTETVTSVYILITRDASTEKIKLFDKKNGWWYDSAYPEQKLQLDNYTPLRDTPPLGSTNKRNKRSQQGIFSLNSNSMEQATIKRLSMRCDVETRTRPARHTPLLAAD